MRYRLPIVVSVVVAAVVAAITVGCARSDRQASEPETSNVLLDKEPASAIGVRAAVRDFKNDQAVVIVGRIGGDRSPFVDGLAAFTIVDTSLVPCNERPGDTCPTPWDYCCDISDLPRASAAVKIVDPSGHVIEKDVKQLLKVKELDTVVARGRAQRDAEGNLVVLADGIYVRK